MRPASITTSRSARRSVESRCAIAIVVLNGVLGGDDAANALLTRELRKPWSLTKV